MPRVGMLVVGLLFTSLAHAQQGEIVSYHVDLPFGTTVIDTLPASGFVLTDVSAAPGANTFWELEFIETIDNTDTTKLKVFLGYSNSGATLWQSFNSGIPFAGGSTLTVHNDTPQGYLTISGYIPTPAAQGSVPAVSTWGLIVFGLLMLTGGSMIVLSRKTSMA